MHVVPRIAALLLGLGLCTVATAGTEGAPPKRKRDNWIQLFNGKNLDGWKPKIRSHELGDNYLDTFRVENGILKVSYDKYAQFDNAFGHLAYSKPFSSYRIRIEYRFVGDQVSGGPGWAVRNSGVMLHGQAPQTIGLDQRFPVSIEAQFLGGLGTRQRTTANMCSPGTHVMMDGKLIAEHCINSTSETYHGDQWVTFEAEVRGSKLIKHFVQGKQVMEYAAPQMDDTDPVAKRLIAEAKGKKLLDAGYIYLQSESHPIEFRKVEILELVDQGSP